MLTPCPARGGRGVRRRHGDRRRFEKATRPAAPRAHCGDQGPWPVSRFLIGRLGALGDVVHAIPVAAALRRTFPSARIDWLVSAKHREILDLVPVIDRRLVINDRGDASGGASLLAAVRELRRSQYDVAIDLQGLIKSALLARSSGAPRSSGFRPVRGASAPRACSIRSHDLGPRRLYDPRETRHVVDITSRADTPRHHDSPREFPMRMSIRTQHAARVAEGGLYALLNPARRGRTSAGRRRSSRRSRWSCARGMA